MSEWVPTTRLACEYETWSTNQPVYCVQEKTHPTHRLKPDLNLQQQSDKWGRICVHTNDAWPSLELHTCTYTYTGGQRWPVITITGGGRPHEKWVGLGYPQHSWWDGWPRPSPTLDYDNDNYNDNDKDSGGGIKNESGL